MTLRGWGNKNHKFWDLKKQRFYPPANERGNERWTSLKMYFLLNMQIFQCYVCLKEGIHIESWERTSCKLSEIDYKMKSRSQNFVKTICEKNIGSDLLLSVEVQRPVTKDYFLSRESESSKICGYHFQSLWLPGTIVFYCNDVCFDSIRNFSWVQDQHIELPRAMMQQQLHQRSIGNSLRRKMMWTNPR